MSDPEPRLDEEWALKRAVQTGCRSPCEKSRRGVVVWERAGREQLVSEAFFTTQVRFWHSFNRPPVGFRCDGSDHCRRFCGQLCVHAEQAAILAMLKSPSWKKGHDYELLHVKVVGGEPVPSGLPSCWHCSKLILEAGIQFVWLFHEDGLRRYPAQAFHVLTLAHHGMPILETNSQ